MKFELGAKLMSGIGATLIEIRTQLQGFEDDLRNKGFYDMFITSCALVITIGTIGIYDLINNPHSSNESKPLSVVKLEKECVVTKVNGQRSIYVCEPKSKETITLEKTEPFIIKDRCSLDPFNSKRVNCYDTEKDKVMAIEKNTKKVNITCVQDKSANKFKCYRHL